jgi:hypothetical protein
MSNLGHPNHLYKYLPFSANVLGLLCQSEVFYSNPSKFNDPFDSKPNIINDLGEIFFTHLWHAIISKAVNKTEATNIHFHALSEVQEYGSYKVDGPAKLLYRQRIMEAIEDLVNRSLKRHGVFSLAEKWNCPLMWSHYGDQHRGICIEYLTKDRLKKARIDKVEYGGSRNITTKDLYHIFVDESKEIRERTVKQIYYSKAKQWKYEREWRALNDFPGTHSSTPFLVSAIYFGIRCDHAVKTTLIKLLSHTDDSRIQFFDVCETGKGFSLRRSKIDTSETLARGTPTPHFKLFEFLDEIDLSAVDVTED